MDRQGWEPLGPVCLGRKMATCQEATEGCQLASDPMRHRFIQDPLAAVGVRAGTGRL